MNRAERRRQEKAAKKSKSTSSQSNALVEQKIKAALEHHNSGRLAEAEQAYRQILKSTPNQPMVLHFLGVIAMQNGEFEVAEDYISKAISLQPGYSEAHGNLGVLYRKQRKWDKAIASYRKAIAINPKYAEGHYNLGIALSEQGNPKEAIASYLHALELNPNYSEAHYNLALELQKKEEPENAISAYHKAISINPNYSKAFNGLGNILKELGLLTEAQANYRRALDAQPDYTSAHSNILLTMQYELNQTSATLLEQHQKWERDHCQGYQENWPVHNNSADTNRRLRVGFVSPDLGNHPVGYFIVGLLEHLPKSEIESICYSDRKADELTHRIKAAADVWNDVTEISDEDLFDTLLADHIDILIDLSGHSGKSRLHVFARKPAPVQVAWAGYVGTTGLSAIDYLISDRYSTPEGEDAHYVEKIARMPDGWLCYDPPSYAPAVSSLPFERNGYITFCSFSNPAKINEDVLTVWAQILTAVPNSKLLLQYASINTITNRERLIRSMEAKGIDPERLELKGRYPHPDLLARYNDVDIALDPFPYSGGLTTYEAIWMGVPVVTMPGNTFASRHSTSHLMALGTPELIAADESAYVQLAVNLASDPAALAQMRQNLRPKMEASPICDHPKFAAGFAKLLRDMWRNWCLSNK